MPDTPRGELPKLDYRPPVSENHHELPLCRQCAYPLILLDRGRCPECGTQFDLDDRKTFTLLNPIDWLRYWLPAFVVLGTLWLGYACVLIENNSIGWSLVLATPASIGMLAGYGMRSCVRRRMIFAFCLLAAVTGGLIVMNVVGVFCGTILAILALVPYGIGSVLGIVLRGCMKDVSWYSQRKHLPVLAILALPVVTELAQQKLALARPIVSQSTAILLNATLEQAWHAHAEDDEDVSRSMLHLIRLTRPLEQVGGRGIGEESTIRFSKGELRVRVAERAPPKRFAIAYVGQSRVEDRAIRLIDSSFDYSPTLKRQQTQLTITTRYEALMTPRWCWMPFEHWAGEVTHELIGRQLQHDINQRWNGISESPR